MPAQSLTRDYLRSILQYNLSTGEFTWRNSRGHLKAGARAGSKNGGYIRIRIDAKGYYAQRLAFLYMLNRIPNQVDHINHIRTDNRWINLRPANPKINSKNQSFHKNNTTGHMGIEWHKGAQKWRPRITVDGKILTFGLFVDLDDAIAARKAACIKWSFHKNHGT